MSATIRMACWRAASGQALNCLFLMRSVSNQKESGSLRRADAAGMSRSIPLEKALDDTIIAWGQNGEASVLSKAIPYACLTRLGGKYLCEVASWLEIGDKPGITAKRRRNIPI